jgi:Domain of unknown function (DUF1998)
MTRLGSVRRSQVVTTYGPGALIAVDDESFMVAGIDRWDVVDADTIAERRLEQQLRVHALYLPPSETESFRSTRGLPVIRFPLMHSCPECRRLDWFWKLSADDKNVCARCDRPLVPSRFVIACASGHIDDFPYSRWVHEGRTPDGDHRLELTTRGASASLRDILITCSCDARRSLDGAFDRRRIAEVTRCQGRRPWLGDQEECGSGVRTLQRGASNVWFSSVRSALSIPPWSDGVFQLIERYWLMLKSVTDPDMLKNILTGMGAALTAHGYDVDELVRAVLARQAEEAGEVPADAKTKAQEYDALLAGRAESDQNQQFVAEPFDPPADLAPFIEHVVAVPRLREVRALLGFTRLQPSSPDAGDASREAPLSRGDIPWLPAIEVRGEGVFLVLGRGRLAQWEQQPEVIARCATLDRNNALRAAERRLADPEPIAPRFVLVHSLAHALIEQMSLDAGYPAASLRERLYVSDDMAGLLIYTATSDSAGSLGGLIAQTRPDRLASLVLEALGRAAWCSADPVCIESTGSGADGLNLAACHACSLLPETSCEEKNTLLDRGLLIGTPEHPDIGYLSDLVRGL